jgi:beta-lactamase regulating signal transducer with metallopeptidase domain
MWELVDQLGVRVLVTMLSAAILLSIVIVAMICCHQPSRRRALARAGILAVLSLPTLAAILPSLAIPIRPTLVGLVTTALSVRPEARLGETRLEVGTFFEEGSGKPWFLTVTRALTLGYLGVTFAAVGSLLLSFCVVGLVIRRAKTPSDATLGVYQALLGTSGADAPRLLVSSRLRRPVLAGFLRPIILIPPDLDRLADESRLRLALLHELAHARSRDTVYSTLTVAARGLYFPLPQILWISAQLRLDQELLADRSASVDFGGTLNYGASLLELAEDLAPPSSLRRVDPEQPRPVQSSRPKSRLPETSSLVPRLLMLIGAPFVVEPTPPRWWSYTLAALICTSTLIASRFTLDRVRSPIAAGSENALQVFTASRLEIPGGSGYPGQSHPPYALPLIMPENFRLSARIFASDQDLEKIELLGHRLSSPSTGSSVTEAEVPASWRDVRLKRDGSQVDIWVDKQSVPADARDTTERLSILPPEDESLLIEDLWVRW